MEDTETRKLNMGEATEAVLNAHKTLWEMVKAIVAKVEKLAKSIVKLKNLSKQQDAGTGGEKSDKEEKREAMADMGEVIAGALAVYAEDTEDEELLAEIDFERSDLMQGKDSDVVKRNRLVHQRASEHEQPLKDEYDIQSDAVKEYEQAINDFEDAVPAPTVAKAENTAITGAIKKEFIIFDDALDALDKLLLKYKKPEPEFYKAYTAARKIIDTGTRSTALIVTVEEKDIRIKGVKVEVIHPNGTVVTKTSSVRGIARFKDSELEAGVYTVKISKPGYQPQTIANVSVKEEGVKIVRLKVELKPV